MGSARSRTAGDPIVAIDRHRVVRDILIDRPAVVDREDVACDAHHPHGRAAPPARAGPLRRRAAVIIVCLDLEGVLAPEIWIEFASHAKIDELKLTTRDEPDYDKLMRRRLRILEDRGLGLPEIQQVIGNLEPLPGAREFLDQLRATYQVAILSDTYYEFAQPLMRQLGWPTLFCHRLQTDQTGRIVDYRLRMNDQKRAAVAAFRGLNFGTIAVGDSYNDTSMLREAHVGVFFRPPASVAAQFPQFAVTSNYTELKGKIAAAAATIWPSP
jgi:phosphoserine / homoserine phosphotransferase